MAIHTIKRKRFIIHEKKKPLSNAKIAASIGLTLNRALPLQLHPDFVKKLQHKVTGGLLSEKAIDDLFHATRRGTASNKTWGRFLTNLKIQTGRELKRRA